MEFTFLTIGVQEKQSAYGASVLKFVKHKVTWLGVKDIVIGTRISLNKITEILDILQEECGEAVVAISKCRRFGMENSYKDGGTQREHLTQEAGDVILLLDFLIENNIFTQAELDAAKLRKKEKLKVWSRIYEQD